MPSIFCYHVTLVKFFKIIQRQNLPNDLLLQFSNYTATILYGSPRYYSQKSHDNKISVDDLTDDDSTLNSKKKYSGKTPEIPKIYLRNENDHLLGLMTLAEAEKLAKKHKKQLIQIEEVTKKIMTMKFVDPRFKEDKEEDITSSKSLEKSDFKKTIRKTLFFTSKLSNHDLQIKINQIKKFVLKGYEILIRINSTKPDNERLNNILREFELIFNEKNGVKTQKRLTDTSLKFNIMVIDLESFKQKVSSNQNKESFLNMNELDPNKLLNDETIIDKIKDYEKNK